MKKTFFVIGMILLLASGQALAAGGGPPPKPACGTSGPLAVTDPSPPSYSYVVNVAGSTTASFTVSSPAVDINGSCDSSLSYVYGNGNSGAAIDVSVSVGNVSGGTLTAAQQAALKAAFSFTPASFTLTNPGTGNQGVVLTFTNNNTIPAGTYDVTIDVKPETGVGVGAASTTFTITVTDPVAVDSLPPTVNIVSPTASQKFALNALFNLGFTAKDPPEGGAGTGVTAVRASITGCNGIFNLSIPNLGVSPTLPVAADVLVTATKTNITAGWIGTFNLIAEADDNAGHTGSAQVTFSVGVNIGALPPISVPNRQFKVGSTVPIKWKITDANGAFLSPFTDVKLTIVGPNNLSEDRFAGDGADFIHWELDEYGKATQYITNYQIPVEGNYTVKISVVDECDNEVEQGSFTFFSSTKGGKY
jgi:hypothetical protein